MTLTQIKKELKKLGCEIDIDETETDNGLEFTYSTDTTSYSFEIEQTQLTHCCGVVELGGIYEYNKEYIRSGEKRIRELLIIYAFLDRKLSQYISKGDKRGINKKRPIIFCSNGLGVCKEIENILETELSNHYKLISTTQNPNSGNTIKMYISY